MCVILLHLSVRRGLLRTFVCLICLNLEMCFLQCFEVVKANSSFVLARPGVKLP